MSSTAEDKARCQQQIDRVLATLGLRPSMPDGGGSNESEPFDFRKAPAYPFENDAIFVAMSCGTTPKYEEEDEVRWLTAVGMVVLDTRDLSHLSPGKGGMHWMSEVQGAVVWAIDGRQTHAHASVLASASPSVEIVAIEDDQLRKALRNLGADGSRDVIILTDRRADHQGLLGSVTKLKNKHVIFHVDPLDIYHGAIHGSVDISAPNTLRELCLRVGVPTTDLRNVGFRAICSLQAMLATAVKAAALRADAKGAEYSVELEASDVHSEAVKGRKIAKILGNLKSAFRWAAEGGKSQSPSKSSTPESASIVITARKPGISQSSAGASSAIVSPGTSVKDKEAKDAAAAKPATQSTYASTSDTSLAATATSENSVTSEQSDSVPASTATEAKNTSPTATVAASATPPQRPAPQESATASPTTEPASQTGSQQVSEVSITHLYDCKDFLEDHDRFLISWSSDEVFNLPCRIADRVEEYTLATEMFERELVNHAITAGVGSGWFTDGLIDPPILNFAHMAYLIRRGLSVEDIDDLLTQIRDIVAMRMFVSAWHDNIPGVASRYGIIEKTARHRAFTAMLRRVHEILER